MNIRVWEITQWRCEPQAPSLVEVFCLRAEARALLWQLGKLDLHTAVDVLQADAKRDGLVVAIGRDRVQSIVATAFRMVRS